MGVAKKGKGAERRVGWVVGKEDEIKEKFRSTTGVDYVHEN